MKYLATTTFLLATILAISGCEADRMSEKGFPVTPQLVQRSLFRLLINYSRELILEPRDFTQQTPDGFMHIRHYLVSRSFQLGSPLTD